MYKSGDVIRIKDLSVNDNVIEISPIGYQKKLLTSEKPRLIDDVWWVKLRGMDSGIYEYFQKEGDETIYFDSKFGPRETNIVFDKR